MSFASLWRRNLALARLAALSQLEYRLNFFIDAVMQPLFTTCVEVLVWMAIFDKSGISELNGFGREYYLAYAIWAVTVGRLTANWMYEFMMIDDIDQGRVNSVLVRPVSFYNYYLFQFLGYKLSVMGITIWAPAVVCSAIGFPIHWSRIPLMLLMLLGYIVFTLTLSYVIAAIAFFVNRAHFMTMVKNMAIWVLGGEFFPLDLIPEPFRSWVIHLPFAAGVYLPVGYVTGRFDETLMLQGFASLFIGTLVLAVFGKWIWARGLKIYSGTGA